MSEEKTCSCRLNEKELSYLNKYWDGKFSDYAHSSLKRDIKLVKNNRLKNFFERFNTNIVMIGIGAIFVLFSLTTTNILALILLLLMGVFFVMNGLTSITIGVIDKWKMKDS